jgi:protein TonB
MPRINYRLLVALAVSLGLHLLPLINWPSSRPLLPPKPPMIAAELRTTTLSANPVPLMLDAAKIPVQVASNVSPPAPKSIRPGLSKPTNWQAEVKRQLKKMDERGLFYPPEAIAQGLQGEVLILLMIDESGHISAARVEESSGYALLDNAALRAVRALHSLPADAPRETLLPVSFKLH